MSESNSGAMPCVGASRDDDTVIMAHGSTHDDDASASPRTSSGNPPPRVGIGVPIYNNKPFLREALDSLLAVVANGRLYTRESLEAQRARYQDFYESPVFDTLSVAIARRVLGRIGSE